MHRRRQAGGRRIEVMIIDPPVSPFSPPADLRGWLDELATMPQREPEVKRAIEEAERWLKYAEQAAPAP
jgi:hypothetical protein